MPSYTVPPKGAIRAMERAMEQQHQSMSEAPI